jgi:hypothetical protein
MPDAAHGGQLGRGFPRGCGSPVLMGTYLTRWQIRTFYRLADRRRLITAMMIAAKITPRTNPTTSA